MDEFEKELVVTSSCSKYRLYYPRWSKDGSTVYYAATWVYNDDDTDIYLMIWEDAKTPVHFGYDKSYTFWVPNYSKLIQYYVFNDCCFYEEGIADMIIDYLKEKNTVFNKHL